MSNTGDFFVNCPACGKRLKVRAELAGKRIKCACGNTFAAVASAAPVMAAVGAGAPGAMPHAGGGPAMPVGYRGPTPAAAKTTNPDHSAIIKQSVILAVVLVVIIGGVFGLKFIGSHAGKNTKPSLGEDAKVEEMISDENGTEVREWLKGRSGRMLGGMTSGQAENRVNDWYSMGAVKVYAFGGTMSLSVAIELPQDPAKRKQLFEWYNQNQADPTDPTTFTKDVGQKFLLVRLHL